MLGGVLAGVLGVFMVGALWGVRTFSTDDSQAASFCEACMNVAGALLENVHETSRGDCPGTVPGLFQDCPSTVLGLSLKQIWGGSASSGRTVAMRGVYACRVCRDRE